MSTFRPLPFLSNPHVQTVLGTLIRGQARPVRGRKRIVALPDGDRIVLHEAPPRVSHELERIAVLVHGLGGDHRSPYMERTAHRLGGLGWRVFRMDLRGAGAGVKMARRTYNAACSDDVRAVVANLSAAFPTAALAVIGFSLGGNIVLKYAGESAGQTPPGLCALATLAPPIDLVRCAELIARYPLYDSYYLQHLVKQVARHQRHFLDLPRVVFPRRLTLRQFDDIYTAPHWGYADALDYYRKASAQPWIARIAVPTFILAARDDPFVAVEPFEALHATPGVEIHISAHGGHLGFLGSDGAGGIRWAETQLVNWLQNQVAWRAL